MDKKLIVILSKEKYLSQMIEENLECNIKLFNCEKDIAQFLEKPEIIDSLIIDGIIYNTNIIANYARYIFSFSETKIKHQIILQKPFNLPDFLYELESAINNSKLFVILDKHIYSELRSDFTYSNGRVIKLSYLENRLIKNLLLSKDFYLSKEFLQENVWKYSKKAESTTMKQTILKLKKALPHGLLGPYEDGYKIFAQEIC